MKKKALISIFLLLLTTGCLFGTVACKKKNPSDVDEHIHEYSTEWTIDVPATCTSEGSKSHHCKSCGAKTDVTKVDKVAHNYSNGVCTVCGENEI